MVIITSIFVLAVAPAVRAHFGGMPIFKINGVFALPDIFDNTKEYAEMRDRAPEESYPIGSSMNYEIDPTYIPASDATLRKTLFTWDFGDGSKTKSGIYMLKQTHEYPNQGEFTLKVSMDATAAGFPMEPQVIEVVPIVIGNPVLAAEEKVNYLVQTEPVSDTRINRLLFWNIVIGLVMVGLLGLLIKLRKDK